VVRPARHESNERRGARTGAPASECHRLAESGIVGLGQRLLAIGERIPDRLGQHVFGIALAQLRLARLFAGNARAHTVICFRDVYDQMRERHLLRRRMVAVFVGRHFFGSADQVL